MKPAPFVAMLLAGAGLVAQAADTRTWAFRALLDDRPIGEHRFTVVTDGAGRQVTSEVDFSVKFLGLDVFHCHPASGWGWTRG